MTCRVKIPQIVYSQPPTDKNYKSPISTYNATLEGEILIHFPGWNDAEYNAPLSPEEIDLSDYPMAILTQGASRTDPITAVSEKVQIFYPPIPRLSLSDCLMSESAEDWRLSVELEYSSASEGDSSGSLSPISSASSAFPSPKVTPCEITNIPEDKPLRRRGHVRRPSSENQPANRNGRSTPTPHSTSPPTRQSPLPSQSPACDPILPMSPPKPTKAASVTELPAAPLKKSAISRSSLCSDRTSWMTSPDSMPIDWTFLELTLGCASHDPFGSQPPIPPAKVKAKAKTTPTPTPKPPVRTSSLKRKQLAPALEALKEEAEEDIANKPVSNVVCGVKSSRRKAALVGAGSFMPNLMSSP